MKAWQRKELKKLLRWQTLLGGRLKLNFDSSFKFGEEELEDPKNLLRNMQQKINADLDRRVLEIDTLLLSESQKDWEDFKSTILKATDGKEKTARTN